MLGIADPVSAFTHGGGALVFAVLSYPLIRGARPSHRPALCVFAFTVVLLLGVSGAFHVLKHGTAGSAVMQRIDHAAIFALIAGTFTAYHAILFRGFLRWGVLALIWGAAVTGITLKTIFFDGMPYWLGGLFYLAMGWCGAVTMVAVWRAHGRRATLPIIAAGLAYTLGAVIELAAWPTLVPGVVMPHEVFHVLVLVGAGIFWRHVSGFTRARGNAALRAPEPVSSRAA